MTKDWVLKKRAWTELQRELLPDYFSEFAHQSASRNQFRIMISKQVCAEPLMLRCMKLLGIGMINAFALLAIIGDVRRFERSEKLAAYVGLNPGQRESGAGKRIKLGIGLRGRGDMRNLLIQGAQAVLRIGRNTALGKWGWKLSARKCHRNVAVAAIARKLIVQVWHLLSGNPPNMLESNKSLDAKLTKILVLRGKELRKKMGLPATLAACVLELRSRIDAIPTATQ